MPFEYEGCKAGEEFDYEKGTGGFLKMIGLSKESQSPMWYILPPSEVHNLSAYKLLPKGNAVAGICGDQIYYLDRNKYDIVKSWKEIKKISLADLFNEAHSFDDDKGEVRGKNLYRKLSKFNYVHRFNGWQLIHEVKSGSDIEVICVHFFFRNIRTIATCQHARAKSKNVFIMK